MKSRFVFFGAIATLLIVSVGLKAQRYLTSHINENFRLGAIISDVLKPQGWVEIESPPTDRQLTLSIFKFKKLECDKPLLVTFLNFGDATSNALQSAIGSNITFIYDGKTSNSFPAKKQFYRVMLQSVQNMLRFNDNHELPIIAISDYSSDATCDSNLVQYWPQIEQKFNK
jgi:hypothetical protein